MEPSHEPYLARVHQLAAGPGTQIESVGQEVAVLRPADAKRRIAVVRYEPGADVAVRDRLKQIMRAAGPLALEVLLVGGPASARSLLKEAKPWVTGSRQFLYHASDDGELWCDAEGPSYAMLTAPPPPIDETAIAALRGKAALGRKALAAERSELADFVGRHARRPVVTLTVLGIIAVVLGMEQVFGGVESTPTLLRMGALHPPLVRAGEVWRLASCTFLHAGVVHALMNGYVLFALGSSLERILGPWRFVLLYSAAAFGGSLVSYLRLGDGFSVGASGALWGCLGAHAVLAFRPRGLLPTAMLPSARQAAVINLGLNIVVSFRPHVDWAAHAGGGIVGAALMYSVLAMGLPKLGEIETAGAARPDRMPPAIRPVAALLAGLLLAGLCIALVRGRPWELNRAPTFEKRTVAALHAELEVPSSLTERRSEDVGEGGTQVVFGDIPADPVLVGVTRIPLALPEGAARPDAQALGALRDEVRESLGAEISKSGKIVDAPRDEQIGGRLAVRARYRYPNSVEVDVVVVLFEDAFYRVEVARLPGAKWPEVASRVAASIRPVPPR